MGRGKTGRVWTEEEKQRRAESRRKFWKSDRGKEAIKKNPMLQKGRTAWNKGLTKETSGSMKKISEKRKTIKLSDAHIAALQSEESIRKRAESNRGKISWNKGLTKHTSESVARQGKKSK